MIALLPLSLFVIAAMVQEIFRAVGSPAANRLTRPALWSLSALFGLFAVAIDLVQ